MFILDDLHSCTDELLTEKETTTIKFLALNRNKMECFSRLMSLAIWVVLCGIKLQRASAVEDWGYDQGGEPPNQWFTVPGSEACDGTVQSPVDIDTTDVVFDRNPPFLFNDLIRTNKIELKIINEGKTVKISLENQRPILVGGGIQGIFKLAQIHFHWGIDSSRGSEHTINGQSYAMEMHMVFTSERNSNFVVLGTLIEGGAGSDNINFDPIVSHLDDINDVGEFTEIPAFSLRQLFPSNITCYYRYCGSLTTPPCTENVIWTVFQDTIYLSESQLNKFRQLNGDSAIFPTTTTIVDNYRPVQPLNCRQVTSTCSTASSKSKVGDYGCINCRDSCPECNGQ